MTEATVYRTLEFLAGNGILSVADRGNGHLAYELSSEAHHHLICRNCGAQMAIEPVLLASAISRMESKTGYRISAGHLTFLRLVSGLSISFPIRNSMNYSPLRPMHIPDGFLSTLVAVVFWVFSAMAVAYALRHVGKDLGERQVPLMGVLAAAIFAGQLLNFSVTGGTSGHLLHRFLATILLGPWAAVIVLTSVVSIQALIFQDGGLLALGANLFNMAVIGVTVSYFVYTSVQKLAHGRSWGLFVGGFLAAWLSIVVA